MKKHFVKSTTDIPTVIYRDEDPNPEDLKQFPETDGVQLHLNSQYGLNIHNPNVIPNNWNAGCVVAGGKPQVNILEEAGLSGIEQKMLEEIKNQQAVIYTNQATLYNQMISDQSGISGPGGDIGAAESPMISITATEMADKLEALPSAIKGMIENYDEILGGLRSQGDEVAVEIENPAFDLYQSLIHHMGDGVQNMNLPGGGFITQEEANKFGQFQQQFEQQLIFGGTDPVDPQIENSDFVGHVQLMSKEQVISKYGSIGIVNPGY